MIKKESQDVRVTQCSPTISKQQVDGDKSPDHILLDRGVPIKSVSWADTGHLTELQVEFLDGTSFETKDPIIMEKVNQMLYEQMRTGLQSA